MSPNIDDLSERVGESVHSVAGLRVEAGKVAEFATAIGDNNPVYYDEDVARSRGLPAIPAPLTFTRVSMFPHYRPDDAHRLGLDIGFDIQREIHGEQAYEFERPVFVGDVLDGTTTLTDVSQREGSRGGTMTFATLETAYEDSDGDLVVTERSTIIETEAAIDDGDVDMTTDEVVPPQPDGATVSQTTADHELPTSIEAVEGRDSTFEITVENITRPDFVRYAGASGDFNPIHYDEEYARSLGNPRVFGQGMLTAGYMSVFASNWFGIDSIRTFETRFLDRIWPGDTLVFSGTVQTVDTDTITADIVGERENGDAVIEGEVVANFGNRSEA